ncbi:MBL fold metallo-hydrolase [Mariniluteicoccus endophyticus]
MFIASFAAGPWQTNCYVVASSGDGGQCVVIDPGVGAAEGVHSLLSDHDLTLAGVVATHGHIDHVYAVSELCAEYQVPVWIHEADRHLLTEPLAGVGPMAKDILMQLHGSTTLDEPADVRELVDGETLDLAGMAMKLTLAPGHTQGCVLLETPYATEGSDVDRLVFTGDVLFQGSIGRTDLPGGDHDQMLESLRTKVLPIADTAALLPGHGGQTSMARERATNPYLQKDML